MSEIAHPAPDGWLKRFFLSLVILALLAGLLLVPWAVCWLTASGELDQEEVVARQAQGEFVLFGPGLAQDIMAYKLALYAAVKPEVVVLGSSRAGNVRAAFFERPFVNMAGAATDLESLRLLVDRMLAVHRPKVVLLGLDFWWLTAGAPAGVTRLSYARQHKLLPCCVHVFLAHAKHKLIVYLYRYAVCAFAQAEHGRNVHLVLCAVLPHKLLKAHLRLFLPCPRL